MILLNSCSIRWSNHKEMQNMSLTSVCKPEGSMCSAGGLNLGGVPISGSRSTFRLGVKGSGKRMLRGKALSMRLRIWMQLGGTALHTWTRRRVQKCPCQQMLSLRSGIPSGPDETSLALWCLTRQCLRPVQSIVSSMVTLSEIYQSN